MVWAGTPATVDRRRILDEVTDRRLVLLGAPGGSGKTTTAEQILATWELAPLRVRWTRPTDLTTAVADLVRSVRRGGLGDVAAAMTTAITDSPEAALDTLVGIARERDLAVGLLLDDVQHLEVDAARQVVVALRDLPDRTRVIVAGRDLGPFAELDRLPGAVHVSAESLRMTDDEIAVLLEARPDDVVVREVAAATTGWCAAVALATQRLRTEPTWSLSATGGARALLEELVDEMVAYAPRFASFAELPLIDDSVAALVAGPATFDDARRAGLLAQSRGRWWIVPDPIREALRPSEPISAPTRAAVAVHYHEHGELHAAIELLRSGPTELLVRFLAARHWTELESLEPNALLALVGDLQPDDWLVAPDLLVTIAWALELRAPDRRAPFLDRARELCDDTGPLARAARAEIARDLCSAARLDEATALAQQVLDECGPDEAVTQGRALTTLARVSVFHCTPESLVRGAELYADTAHAFEAAGETRWLADTLARRGYTALYMAGSPGEGEIAMRAALALLPTGDYTRGFWLTNYSDLLDYLGRVTESEAAAHEALEIGRRRRDPTLEGMAWWSLSWVAAHRGDRPGFLAAIDAFERAAGSWIRPGQLVEYLGSTAEWLAMLGETERCTAFIARGRTAAAAADYPTPIELAEARLLAMHGDPDAAIELLERLDSGLALVPSNRPTRVILRALAELRRGDTGRALLLRDEARAAAAAMGVPDLLERHAQPVMRAFEAIADPSTGDVDAEGSTAAATLRMLGGFSVERAGAPCTPQPGHPATLVKLLALQGVMTVDAALDALWPDADLATGRARLRNLLNRLKQRAGELVVRDAETLRVHPSVVIDLDVFDRRAGAALAADPAERVGLARHAISLYTGELLPGDVYEDWALGPRERSKRRYLALVDVVADDAIARGDADEAVRLLDLGIAAEPLDEDRYSRMCAVLVEQGRIGTAREVAARAVATLAEIGEVADPRLRELVGR